MYVAPYDLPGPWKCSVNVASSRRRRYFRTSSSASTSDWLELHGSTLLQRVPVPQIIMRPTENQVPNLIAQNGALQPLDLGMKSTIDPRYHCAKQVCRNVEEVKVLWQYFLRVNSVIQGIHLGGQWKKGTFFAQSTELELFQYLNLQKTCQVPVLKRRSIRFKVR